MAGFDRNQVADIIRNARPTSSESGGFCEVAASMWVTGGIATSLKPD
jgi:hypothetical protein